MVRVYTPVGKEAVVGAEPTRTSLMIQSSKLSMPKAREQYEKKRANTKFYSSLSTSTYECAPDNRPRRAFEIHPIHTSLSERGWQVFHSVHSALIVERMYAWFLVAVNRIATYRV